MVGELEVIFGVHPVARHLRIARHVAVLLEQLRRIAARAAVDPVAAVALTLATATLTRAIAATTTAATATVLPVVDQNIRPRLKTASAPTAGCT